MLMVRCFALSVVHAPYVYLRYYYRGGEMFLTTLSIIIVDISLCFVHVRSSAFHSRSSLSRNIFLFAITGLIYFLNFYFITILRGDLSANIAPIYRNIFIRWLPIPRFASIRIVPRRFTLIPASLINGRPPRLPLPGIQPLAVGLWTVIPTALCPYRSLCEHETCNRYFRSRHRDPWCILSQILSTEKRE